MDKMVGTQKYNFLKMTNHSTELFQKALSLGEQVQAPIGECIETVVALWELV